MENTYTLEQIYDILHPTVKQCEHHINKLRGRELSVEEDQRLQLNLDMLDYVKDREGLWPVED
jgi:hypothetical protein